MHPEVFEVDHVEVGLVAGGNDATIEQSDRLRGGAALLLHEPLRSEELAAIAVAAPVRQQGGREARIADRADVRPTVAQSGNGVRMGQQLPRRVEVAVGEVEDRPVEECVPAVAEHQVVEQPDRVDTVALGAGGDALRRSGLVVRRVAELEDAIEHVLRATAGVVGDIRDHPRAQLGIAQHVDALRERRRIDLAERGGAHQRVHGGLQADEHADAASGYLRPHPESLVVRGGE